MHTFNEAHKQTIIALPMQWYNDLKNYKCADLLSHRFIDLLSYCRVVVQICNPNDWWVQSNNGSDLCFRTSTSCYIFNDRLTYIGN